MNRAEAIPVDGSRSTTEPPDGRAPTAPPPALGAAAPPPAGMSPSGTSPSGAAAPPAAGMAVPAMGDGIAVPAAGVGDLAVRPAVRLRPPAPGPRSRWDRAAGVIHEGLPDRIPARRAGPAVPPERQAVAPIERRVPGWPAEQAPAPRDHDVTWHDLGVPAPSGRQAVALPDPRDAGRPDQWTGQVAETRTGGGSVTRRIGRGRGPVAARRVVGL